MKHYYDLPRRRGNSVAIAWIIGCVLGLMLVIGLIVFVPEVCQWRAAGLFAQAQELADSGQPQAAARRAEAAYRLDPENLAALRLAAVSLAASDPATANRLTLELAANPFATTEDLQFVRPTFEKLPISEFDSFLAQLPEGFRTDPVLLNLLSERTLAEKDFKKSAEYAARSLQISPNPAISLRLGRILAATPATQSESVPHLLQAIETGNAAEVFPAIEILVALPKEKLAAARIPDPAALIKKFPEATPLQFFTLFRIEWQLHPDRRPAMLKKLAEWQTSLPRRDLGLWLADEGENTRLLEWIAPREAVTDPALFDRYAQALIQADRAGELLALLPEVGTVSPDLTRTLLASFRQKNQTASLRQLVDQLATRSPENGDYLNLAAYLHFLNNDVETARLAKITDLVEAQPTQRAFRTTLALGHVQKGKYRRALEILSDAPESSAPLTDSDKLILARVWSKTGKKTEARALLVDIKPETLLPEERNLLP